MKKYNFQSYIGKKFGLLTVNSVIKENNISKFSCICDCGNTKIVICNSLIGGHVKSCGCLLSKTWKEIGKKRAHPNSYDLSNSYGIGYTFKGNQFYFDLEDYEKIKQYTWSENGVGYLINSSRDGIHLKLHRLIMNAQDGEIVDHINHNTYDNRKDNLRICDCTGNSRNCRSKKKYKGVFKHGNKYESKIVVNYKPIWIGSFDTEEEAYKAYCDAAIKYHKDYACIESY